MNSSTPSPRRPAARTFNLALLSASIHCAFHATGALAADADASAPAAAASATLSDVVIDNTSRKKKADVVDVQKAPQAVTALSGAKLEEQGVTDLRDIGNVAPGLSQSKTAVSYLNSSIFIRGIGEPDAQGEPSVGVYIDGLYQPKNLGLNQELLDIERVEIFRGPQGQEFGHSSNAGALRITTTDPGPEKTLRAKASYGNYNDTRLGLEASGPLAENVFGGIAVTAHSRDGFTRNVTVDRDTNNVRYAAMRGKLRFTPTNDLDIVLSASGTRDTSTSRGVQNLAFGDEDAHNQLFPAQSFNNYAYSANIDLKIDEHLRLKSITGANGYKQDALFDNTGDVYGRGSQFAAYKDAAYSEELRLIGDYDRTSFVTGLYDYREHWFTNRRANTAANSTSVPSAIRYRPVYTLIDQDTDVVAWFGEGKVKLTQYLTATAGIRYNHEEHTQSNQLYNLVAAAPYQSTVDNYQSVLFGPPQALVWDAEGSHTWATWAPKASLDYTWAPHILQYVTFSEGTKSAGYDYRAQAPNASGKLQAQTPFNPEIAKNLETGIKADWFDGALRTNVSAFYTRFDDIQLTTTDPVLLISRRFNAGEGSTRGLEFEVNLLPVDGLRIDLSGDFLRARLDRFDGVAPTVTQVPASSVNPDGLTLYSGPQAGNALPYSPRFQGRAAASWRQPLPGGNALVVNGSADYQTTSYTDATENPTVKLPAQTYLNAGITWYPAAGHWSTTLAGQNIANKRYALGRGFTPALPLDGTAIYRTTTYNDPRTVTITFRYDL
jgi:iron complex outermembrane recepter protein